MPTMMGGAGGQLGTCKRLLPSQGEWGEERACCETVEGGQGGGAGLVHWWGFGIGAGRAWDGGGRTGGWGWCCAEGRGSRLAGRDLRLLLWFCGRPGPVACSTAFSASFSPAKCALLARNSSDSGVSSRRRSTMYPEGATFGLGGGAGDAPWRPMVGPDWDRARSVDAVLGAPWAAIWPVAELGDGCSCPGPSLPWGVLWFGSEVEGWRGDCLGWGAAWRRRATAPLISSSWALTIPTSLRSWEEPEQQEVLGGRGCWEMLEWVIGVGTGVVLSRF